MRGKISIANLLLAAASSVVALSGLEVGLRWVGPELPEPEEPRDVSVYLHYEDPNGLMEPTPNWEGRTGEAVRRINRDGYRDRTFPKEPERFRIAVLGDSFTMGDGVAVEHSLPKRLEARLRCEGYDVEAINFGLTATNTLNQLAFLEHKVLDYRPDVVLLVFNLNDVVLYDETRFEKLARRGFELEVLPDRRVRIVRGDTSLSGLLYEHFHLYRALAVARNTLRQRWSRSGTEAREDLVLGTRIRKSVETGEYRTVLAAVERMAERVEALTGHFFVAIIPAMTDVRVQAMETFADYPLFPEHGMVIEELERARIPVFDVTRRIVGSVPADLVVSPRDPHFNARGNALLARGIASFLEPRLGDVSRMAMGDRECDEPSE